MGEAATPTVVDLDLNREGSDDRTRRTLAAVKVLVAASIAPGPLTVARLAESTGLTEWAVAELLGSPEYKEMIQAEAQRRAVGIIGKAFARMDIMVDTGPDRLVLEAAKVAISAYKVLNEPAKQHDSDNAEVGMSKFMDLLEKRKQIRRAQVKVVDEDRTRQGDLAGTDSPRAHGVGP